MLTKEQKQIIKRKLAECESQKLSFLDTVQLLSSSGADIDLTEAIDLVIEYRERKPTFAPRIVFLKNMYKDDIKFRDNLLSKGFITEDEMLRLHIHTGDTYRYLEDIESDQVCYENDNASTIILTWEQYKEWKSANIFKEVSI